MKTLNNIIQNIYKSGLIFIAVLFFANTQVFAGENPAIRKTSNIVVELEMKIENWMVSLTNWKTPAISFVEAAEMEEELNIEEWMLNANDFINSSYESELEVEDWMLDASEDNWSVSEEEVLEVENWMTDLSNWK